MYFKDDFKKILSQYGHLPFSSIEEALKFEKENKQQKAMLAQKDNDIEELKVA